MPEVIGVCISKKKGTQKKEVEKIECIPNFGIKGDAHSGEWHRQISLLTKESIDKMRTNFKISLKNGDFAENIIISGVDFKKILVGTILNIGNNVILKVTQIGKECHSDCIIKEKTGNCIMPKEGIFAKVIYGGFIRKGDMIKVIQNV